MPDRLVVVRGGGDLGSGVALRLWRCGFPVVILETTRPIAVRRTVAFSESIYDGTRKVEEAEARRAESAEGALRIVEERLIAVLIDPDAQTLETLQPVALVDAIMAKRNIGTCRTMAPLVIGLGPGFEASIDVHAVVETNRGPNLGRVIWNGAAEPDTGMPGPVRGVAAGRVVDAGPEGLPGQIQRAALGACGVQPAGGGVERLCGVNGGLESGDGLEGRDGDRRARHGLGMAADGVLGLRNQVVGDGAVRAGLASVPHHGTQIREVHGRQRAA